MATNTSSGHATPGAAGWHQRFVFLKGVVSLAGLPPDQGREVAFAGRSNSGKSSVINALIEQRGARVSKTPGRTREMNFFAGPDGVRLVDMPGYGFARASLGQRRDWAKLREEYLACRHSLVGAVLIMDARRPLLEHDWQMLHLCGEGQIPAHILLNKADKLSRSTGLQALAQVRHALRGEEAGVQLFSARKRQGGEQARTLLHAWLFGGEGTLDGGAQGAHGAEGSGKPGAHGAEGSGKPGAHGAEGSGKRDAHGAEGSGKRDAHGAEGSGKRGAHGAEGRDKPGAHDAEG